MSKTPAQPTQSIARRPEEESPIRKAAIRTGDVANFFFRAKQAAIRADHGLPLEGKVTLSFEDPQRMFTVLPKHGGA